jgi:hypothetical protein
MAFALEEAPARGYYEELTREYEQRRDALRAVLEEAGLPTLPVGGAYFLMADISQMGFENDVAFCRWLTEVLLRQARGNHRARGRAAAADSGTAPGEGVILNADNHSLMPLRILTPNPGSPPAPLHRRGESPCAQGEGSTARNRVRMPSCFIRIPYDPSRLTQRRESCAGLDRRVQRDTFRARRPPASR